MSEAEMDAFGHHDATCDVVDSLDRLVAILDHPEERILPLLYGNGPNRDGDTGNSENVAVFAKRREQTLQDLIEISKSLFADIETLGMRYKELSNGNSKTTTSTTSATKTTKTTSVSPSGLVELFVPTSMDPTDADLPETIYGQVELQSEALLKLVKTSTRKLSKAPGDICVLDMGVAVSSSDENDDGNNDDDDDDDNEDENEVDANLVNDDDDAQGEEDSDGGDSTSEGPDDDEEEDEETKRIRQRMERAMEDASASEDDSDNDDQTAASSEQNETKQSKQDDELHDPVAEDMKDGFFDLNEMEEYADEEEDYLPDETVENAEDDNGSPTKKDIPKKSFHQRQREGDLENDSDSDGDDDRRGLDDLYEDVKPIKRKKYRPQEDIDALYNLYQETNPDSEGVDVANMTAADFFGAPKKEYINRYKKNHPEHKKPAGKNRGAGKDDDDSWGGYDFEEEDQSAWRDEADEDHQLENASDEDDGGEEPMTDAAAEDEHGRQKGLGKAAISAKREGKLSQLTEELEKELLAEKPWRMSGETKSTSRPVNSLLEGTPEFEMASKQAPAITVEHTIDLEEAIKKRILAEDWDDVVPRELPDIGWHKKRGELPEVSQEKSKLGLGELYEREYLKKAVGYDVDAAEKKTDEDKAKDEMRQLFANLCQKLDALSNYHFAPRPIADEAEVRQVTTPAIAMEEVLPLHVSDARAVAPEEVYATKRGRDGILRDETEMDQGDRKRLRQSKKATRRKARKEKQADEKLISRLEPGLGLNNPYEKRKAREELATARSRGRVTTGEQDMDSKFGSSGTFFKRLQAEAQQTIQGTVESQRSPETKVKAKSSSFKL